MRAQKLNMAIFLLTAVIIAVILPTKGMFKYTFNMGEVWSYNTLVAPFDFSILKSSEDYDADIAKFKKTYQSVYNRDPRVKERRLAELRTLYGIDSSFLEESMYRVSVPEEMKYKVEAYKAINKILERGIKESDQADNGEMVLRVIIGDDIRVMNRSILYTSQEALDLLNKAIEGVSDSERAEIVNIATQHLSPDVIYNEEVDNYIYNQEVGKISAIKGYVREGAVIINGGSVIDSDKYDTLLSFKNEYAKRGVYEVSLLPFLGNLLFVLIVLILSYFSLYTFDREFLDSTRRVLFLMMLFVAFIFMVVSVDKITLYPISTYIIPFAIFPIYINHFFGSKISIYQYIFVLLIAALQSNLPYQFLIINYLAGVSGMYAIQRASKRGNLFRATVVTMTVSILMFAILSFMQDGNFDNIILSEYVWFIISAVLLVTLYQLIYSIEKLFRFVSNVTLIELNDTNHKLLRELASKAPGTYQHVMQVANLSEAAAKAIKANSLLARTGALYHDIGKMENSKYFIENNKQGEAPHNKLSPLQSAEMIRNHVNDGVRVAKRYNLPKVIVDFITSHHGNSLIYYFFKKYQEEAEREDIDEMLFRYNGTPPHTKETTICMMADAIEAASRTLTEHTPESISDLVDNIIINQEKNGMYVKSPLTFAEMELVKKALKDKVATMYHSRIIYPK